MSHHINILIKDITARLQPRYPDTAEQHAWWLLSRVTMQSQKQLLIQQNILLSDEQESQLAHYLQQLIDNHMPFAYVMGAVPFGDLEILIEPPILIPRPETEQWCLALVNQLQKISAPLTILDMCTGSGCIALTLAHALPNCRVFGVDINEKALTLAQKNALHNNITNVTWIKSDLFTQIPKTLTFDLIVSNPPYISESEWKTLDTSVKDWEDTAALVAPQEGLGILSPIIDQAPAWIRDCKELAQHHIPQLVVEIGYQQAQQVHRLFERARFTDILVNKDLADHDRTVSGRVNHEAIFQKTG